MWGFNNASFNVNITNSPSIYVLFIFKKNRITWPSDVSHVFIGKSYLLHAAISIEIYLPQNYLSYAML